jgi:hypothetical protein
MVGMLVFLFGACASSPTGAPVKGTARDMAVIPADETGVFGEAPADAAMLNEGLSHLSLPDKPIDYAKARKTFAALTTVYPKSRWRPLAETLIRLIDANVALQARSLSAQELTKTLQRENEQLKQDIRSIGSRFQAERAGLLQENEQLKKDMELLKKLEVQLDQREKMLR